MEGENMDNDDKKWKEKLSEQEYHVMRCGGTEPPFTGKYYKHDEKGTYNCNSSHNYDDTILFFAKNEDGQINESLFK